MSFEFGGALLSINFQKIDQKFYFKDLADKSFLSWNFKILLFLRILPLKWYIGHDSTLSGSAVWADNRSPSISIVATGARWIAEQVRAKIQIKETS